MSRAETELSVFESDDELLTFKLLKEANGNLDPYDLTAATVTFTVKANASDSSPMFTYSSGGVNPAISVTSATGGLFQIQFAGTDVATPGNYRYSISVTQSTKRRTVAYGSFTVENI